MTGLSAGQFHAGLLAAAVGSSISGYVARLALFNMAAAAVLIQLLGHVILDVLAQRARVRVPLQTAGHLASVRLLYKMSIIPFKNHSYFPLNSPHSSTSISINPILI